MRSPTGSEPVGLREPVEHRSADVCLPPPSPAGREPSTASRWRSSEAIVWLTKVVESGAMHPDAVAGNDGAAKDRFESGQTLVMNDGVGGWHEALARVRPSNPDFDQMAMDLFAPDGGAPTLYRGAPVNIFSFLKKSEDEDQAARLADWCAPQFGTKEFELLTYGVEGTHFERDEQHPAAERPGATDVTSTTSSSHSPRSSTPRCSSDCVEASTSGWPAVGAWWTTVLRIQIQSPRSSVARPALTTSSWTSAAAAKASASSTRRW